MAPRILLADDSVTVQKVIELTFSDEGMQVIAVGDGDQAIARLAADPPDIVLADVSMPGQDGYQVAAHVKNTPALRHIPVVLMTGAFEQLDEHRARAAGCDGVLAKPFEPQMVISMVRDLLARKGGGAAPVEPPAPAATPAEGYPFEPGTAAGRSPRTLDDFFDRIDEALTAPPPMPPGDGNGRPAAPVRSVPTSPEPAPAQPEGAGPSALADAFSDLLADELGESPLPASWASSAPVPAVAGGAPAEPPAPAPVALDDAQLDEVARQVAARLSDAAIREEVSRRVIEVAERLVREEIARLKPQN